MKITGLDDPILGGLENLPIPYDHNGLVWTLRRGLYECVVRESANSNCEDKFYAAGLASRIAGCIDVASLGVSAKDVVMIRGFCSSLPTLVFAAVYKALDATENSEPPQEG